MMSFQIVTLRLILLNVAVVFACLYYMSWYYIATNHTFKHSPKHRNDIWFVNIDKKIKTKGGSVGTKTNHIGVIYTQEYIKTSRKNHTHRPPNKNLGKK